MIACYPPARRNQALTSLRESSPCQRILPVASNWSHSLGKMAHRRGCYGSCQGVTGQAFATVRFVTTMSRGCTSTRGRSGPPSGSWSRLLVARRHAIDSEAELIQIDRLADDGDRAQAHTLLGGSRGDCNDWNRGQRSIALLATIEILSAHPR